MMLSLPPRQTKSTWARSLGSIVLFGLLLQKATGFCPTLPQISLHTSRRTTMAYQNGGDNETGDDDDNMGWQVLSERVMKLRLDVLEKELQMPPNPRLSACEFVQELLQRILHNEDPLPESGFRLLLRTATEDWKDALYESVGAPRTANEDVVASALGEAMGRKDNQYALLVGEADESYVATFPFEPLDYCDGTAWVECRLRDKKDNRLLVSTGWNLRQNKEGAWMVAGIDWQDFRDKFRPGVGREEWMRLVY